MGDRGVTWSGCRHDVSFVTIYDDSMMVEPIEREGASGRVDVCAHVRHLTPKSFSARRLNS